VIVRKLRNLLFCFLGLVFGGMLIGCGGGTAATATPPHTPAQPVAGTFTVAVDRTLVTAPAGGSIQRVTATITRYSNTNSIGVSVTGMPTGTVATVESQPGTGNSSTIALNPQSGALGSFPITLTVTDGVNTVPLPLTFTIAADLTPQIATPITWSSSAQLVAPVSNSTHSLNAIKDPVAFFYKNQWNVYATDVDTTGAYNMLYLNFSDWSSAAGAPQYYMDQTPGFSGYHCAPQVFYFAPQNKWYMLLQAGPPQLSTNSDPTQPQSWSKPANIFASQPSTVSAWIDFWIICDGTHCFLFFAGDNGIIYRSQTNEQDFPNNFSTPLPILQSASHFDLFESVHVYKLLNTTQYLMMVEGLGSGGHRYFRAFIANSLDGDFSPLANANTWAAPFAGPQNVTFASGVTPWTSDISHGDLIHTGYDETQTVDPAHLQFLYMGYPPSGANSSYSLIGWRLGLLTRSN